MVGGMNDGEKVGRLERNEIFLSGTSVKIVKL